MKKEYILHREKISKLMDNNTIMVLFANKNYESKLEPNKNFLYATNIKENEDILIIVKENDLSKSIVFVRPYDEFFAKWNGHTLTKEEAYELSGADEVLYLDEFESTLNAYLEKGYGLYVDHPQKRENDVTKDYIDVFVESVKTKTNLLDGRKLIQTARTTKTPFEVEQIKKAIDITDKGIRALLDNLKPGLYEYQLESYFDQTLKFNGSTSFAFETIAASGGNATCLHYSTNDSKLNENDLILFDLGATKDYYCADISRTFPVSGKFSPRQKEIYNIVLGGQQHVFKHVKPGITTRELNNKLIEYYQVELKRIGLIEKDEEVAKYYYHGVSHHLGLDCHDLCDYTPLLPGAVITVEPGLYIAEENIGIRIEDDVLVTDDGMINLSEQIIKTVEEIEDYLNK